MKIKRTFVGGKMNKDIDERLLPAGEYPHAENVRVSNTEEADMGSAENVKGNYPLTSFVLSNAVTIGAYTDGTNHKIYWFVTSDTKDLVLEYNTVDEVTSVLLESSKSHGVLNFNKNFLITGVVKVINGNSNKDLLVWTDDYNNPRSINIERCKRFSPNGFEEEDINLIKKPPRFGPKVELTFTNSSLENNLEDKFISLAYRYKYLDGEISALSSFTSYKFAPRNFDLDFQTMENNGMVNFFNALNVKFNTGDRRVKEVEIVYKESNSNNLYLIETFNKEKESWGDNEERSLKFSNSKKYAVLPENELYRQYDNVPRVAKALEMIGNRLVFGNYVEGYNLIDNHGKPVYANYDVTLVNKELVIKELNTTSNKNEATINLSGIPLNQNSRLSFELFLEERGEEGVYTGNLDFILNRKYSSVSDLVNEEDFIIFIEDVMTSNFLQGYSATPPENTSIQSNTKFKVRASGNNLIITSPEIVYGGEGETSVTRNWDFEETTKVFFRETSIDTSLKTNRSYEAGIIYLDKYNRATTVLTDTNNTVFIPQEFSTYQNKLRLNINNNPPEWADRYKIVVKQNKEDYQTIYANIFYEDGLFRWVKLEGANKDKVKEGDILIVKSDIGGPVYDTIKIRVLEVSVKDKNFISENENLEGEEVAEEAGLYMKIKPAGFDMNFSKNISRTFEGSSHLRYADRTYTNPEFGTRTSKGFTPLTIQGGSTVRITIEFKARGNIAYTATYDKKFRVEGNYNSIKEWFEAEVRNLGSFGKEFTAKGSDKWNKGSGWGFNEDGSKFWVKAHRNGTASRSITTDVKFEVLFTEGIMIFETEPRNTDNDIFYETEDVFEVKNGIHFGNIQNQTSYSPAIIELDFYNCYIQGNGAESYRYKDTFNGPFLNIDTRPSTTSIEEYSEVRRYADLTYSATYNENNNINGLNDFNLATANYKEDIDKKYGYIQKLFSRDTDLLVFQEDKISKVMYGKDLLMNADGTYNISAIPEILGRQIAYKGEYGISRNPESFSYNGFNIFFTDAKRGVVLTLRGDGIAEISKIGLRQFFKNKFKDAVNSKKLGAYDPYYEEYVLSPSGDQINLPIFANCSDTISKVNMSSSIEITYDFGIAEGETGISFTSNGRPMKVTLEWNGVVVSSGVVGDEKYNDELEKAGLPKVEGSGNGELRFNKNILTPTKANVTVESLLGGLNFNMTGVCIATPKKEVIFVISNGEFFENKSSINRYKWLKGGYSSSFKTDDTIYGEGPITVYEELEGQQGVGFIPPSGSEIVMEAYSPFNSEKVFDYGGTMKYLFSNEKFNKENILNNLNKFIGLKTVRSKYSNGDVVNTGTFEVFENFSYNYIYIMFDYGDPIKPVDNEDIASLPFGGSATFNVLSNDVHKNLDIEIVITSVPNYGNVVVNEDKTLTYTHNGISSTESDVFFYALKNGDYISESALVSVIITE